MELVHPGTSSAWSSAVLECLIGLFLRVGFNGITECCTLAYGVLESGFSHCNYWHGTPNLKQYWLNLLASRRTSIPNSVSEGLCFRYRERCVISWCIRSAVSSLRAISSCS